MFPVGSTVVVLVANHQMHEFVYWVVFHWWHFCVLTVVRHQQHQQQQMVAAVVMVVTHTLTQQVGQDMVLLCQL
jgi:hypothetical protein